MMIKKLLLPLSLVFIFFGCKKETNVADLLIGKWNFNAETVEYNGEQKRWEASDCRKKSFMEFGSGGAYHEEYYNDENETSTCFHHILDLKNYQYDAASKKLTLTGGKWTYVYKVISISKNKLVIQEVKDDGTLTSSNYEYIL